MHPLHKPNPIRKLDLVLHKKSGTRGIVADVRGQLVVIEVVGEKGADGQPRRATYSHKHLTKVMDAALVVAGAKKLQEEAERRKSLVGKVRALGRRLLGKK